MNDAQRRAVVARYLDAMRVVGDLRVAGTPVREALRDGTVDLWSAGEIRESSAWRDETLPDQIAALLGRPPSAVPPRAAPTRALARAGAAWIRSLLHSFARRDRRPLDADVVFVEYWPSGASVDRDDPGRWVSPYFGSLPGHLRRAGLSVGFVHVHADGPVTRPPRGVRDKLAVLDGAGTPHRLVADTNGPAAWWVALRAWLRLVRRAPRPGSIDRALDGRGDAASLWRWWRRKYVGSVFGSHAVRSCLLSEMFRRLVATNPRTRWWIVASEGQGWEACLARQLDAHHATWLPYLHTMMRPWDLRAHTFLAELAPRRVAVHGEHDRSELSWHGVELLEVEALRYQHLARAVPREVEPADHGSSAERSWLVVGGADCAASSTELGELLAAVARRGIPRRIVVKWHPQCVPPTIAADRPAVLTDRPLHEEFRRADAVVMVGSAAPLDAYLAGLPSCSLAPPSGLATTPLAEDDFFRMALDADDAVSWLAAHDAARNERPPVGRYFVIDPDLPRWRALLAGLTAD